jgi:hypothetical protein
VTSRRSPQTIFTSNAIDAGDIVFDPFLGSGTSIAAAHVLGRAGYGHRFTTSGGGPSDSASHKMPI